MNIAAELERAQRDHRTAWGLGAEGALAEFSRERGEDTRCLWQRENGILAVITPRGGIRVRLHRRIRPVAQGPPHEVEPDWTRTVSLCLPVEAAFMSGHSMVTEVGLDTSSLRRRDRDAILFDPGLGIGHVDACVRTRDAALVDEIRRHCGRSLLAEEGTLVETLIRESPHRVFRSRLGRIEVYQPIPTDVTPQGPHTHLNPLRLARAHPEDMPSYVPDGHVVCLETYPPSPR